MNDALMPTAGSLGSLEGRAVHRIAGHRVANAGKVHPDLVRAARADPHCERREPFS